MKLLEFTNNEKILRAYTKIAINIEQSTTLDHLTTCDNMVHLFTDTYKKRIDISVWVHELLVLLFNRAKTLNIDFDIDNLEIKPEDSSIESNIFTVEDHPTNY